MRTVSGGVGWPSTVIVRWIGRSGEFTLCGRVFFFGGVSRVLGGPGDVLGVLLGVVLGRLVVVVLGRTLRSIRTYRVGREVALDPKVSSRPGGTVARVFSCAHDCARRVVRRATVVGSVPSWRHRYWPGGAALAGRLESRESIRAMDGFPPSRASRRPIAPPRAWWPSLTDKPCLDRRRQSFAGSPLWRSQ